jgi:hypothetical protein
LAVALKRITENGFVTLRALQTKRRNSAVNAIEKIMLTPADDLETFAVSPA